MKAIVVGSQAEGAPLRWSEAPSPSLGPGEVLVDVHATALNRADLLQRAGKYPPPPGASEILGLECSGTVVRLGEGVSGWSIGDRVCALLPGGGYAEQVSVPARMLIPVPAAMSLVEAAALPEVFLTAFSALFGEGRLKDGETVLIHAGASGVGTAAIQLARRAGCRVFVTAGSAEKIAACESLGAELGVNYREEEFEERISDHLGGGGVDVVIDMVGKEYFEKNLRLMNTRGRLVFVSAQSGSRVELNIGRLMAKRLELVGATLRARPLEEKVELKDRFLERFCPDLETGRVKPVIDRIFPITEAEEAHRYMSENRNIGKIVLVVREDWTL
ncbi:MAG TPA: NAD(P)H-quinone oxidoreductase [Trueperaceae bacterium]